MKLKITSLDVAPVTARSEKDEYVELHGFIRDAPMDKWQELSGFENSDEVKKVLRHLRNGRNSMQATYRKNNVTLEVRSNKEATIVYIMKTAIVAKKATVPSKV